MNRLSFQDLPGFARQYQFKSAVLRGIRVRHQGPKTVAVEFRLTARRSIKKLGERPAKVRLTLRLEGVEEFRFQMRPNLSKAKITDARFGYFNGLFYVNLDAWGLEPGEVPRVMDYRASEVYAAARQMSWREDASADDTSRDDTPAG